MQNKIVSDSLGMGLTRVVSGGQTGADQAGLRAALAAGLTTGGWIPSGFITSTGAQPELGVRYQLKALPATSNPLASQYIARSQRNVDESDGTVVFRLHASPGTDKTIGYARTGQWTTCPEPVSNPYRPVCVISALHLDMVTTVMDFVTRHNIGTLNVAGHRADANDALFEDGVFNILFSAFLGLRQSG